jgi:hypothetical protein
MAPILDSSMTNGMGIKSLRIFSRICIVAFVRDASVTNFLELSNESYQWNVSFIRESHDWEVYVFALFFNLYSFRMKLRDEDKFCWVPSKWGSLTLGRSIMSLYLMIASFSIGRVFGGIRSP